MTIHVHLIHEHNRHEVERVLGKERLIEDPDRFHLKAEIAVREEPYLKALLLNQLHGVRAEVSN